ncbi:Exosome complex component MTR3 [Chytridiales sp. JEL 0842]|nr:Exosome complex component MTR3 [Chytridiales sp. JEL 0842]
MRPIFAKTGMIKQANGSAYMEAGNVRLVCGVYGPRQNPSSTRSRNFAQQAHLACEFKHTPFSTPKRRSYLKDSQEKDFSRILQQALSPAVRLELYPKSQIDVFVQVLESDGASSCLSLAISCASLALADAGVEMRDLVTGCSAGLFDVDSTAGAGNLVGKRKVAMDCTREEEENEVGSLVLGFMPSLGEVTHLVQSGEVGVSTSSEALDMCVDACSKIHTVVRDILVESLQTSSR